MKKIEKLGIYFLEKLNFHPFYNRNRRKDSKPAGKLVYDGRDGAEDDYIITKDIFRIGSSKTNDAILNSKAVSSSHAKIYRENGEYFLEDMNSLNGSYIQGGILNYKEKVKLKTMDVIRFADVSFVFM